MHEDTHRMIADFDSFIEQQGDLLIAGEIDVNEFVTRLRTFYNDYTGGTHDRLQCA